MLQPFYHYDVGNLVLLSRRGRVWTIIWRGPLLVREVSGVVRRVPVYRLDNGHWDAYHETDFQAFGQWEE